MAESILKADEQGLLSDRVYATEAAAAGQDFHFAQGLLGAPSRIFVNSRKHIESCPPLCQGTATCIF